MGFFNQTLLPIEKILAKTKEDNIPSQKVLKKAGYEYKNQTNDLYIYELTKKKY
jgi:RimJ/RimL family protein N-acetyltransferase